jgi:hypothetical protein
LFGDFKGYVDFFLFQDFVTEDYSEVRVAPPFDDFVSRPVLSTVEEYMRYMVFTEVLIQSRDKRIGEIEFCEEIV